MRRLLIISVLTLYLNADIIDLAVMVEGNKVTEKHNTRNSDMRSTGLSTKDKNNNITEIDIGNFWKFGNKTLYKYNTYKILNKKEISKKYMIMGNKLKIYSKEKNYIESFVIEAKPDRPKYYWRKIEENKKYYEKEMMKKNQKHFIEINGELK